AGQANGEERKSERWCWQRQSGASLSGVKFITCRFTTSRIAVKSDACSILFRGTLMAKQCGSCHGTGKCQVCKGTGRFGYPGVGPVDNYPDHCNACQSSGDCRACRGTGQQ